MNPAAILALIGELYANTATLTDQLQQVQQQNAVLAAENEQLRAGAKAK